MREVAHSDEPTANYHQNLQLVRVASANCLAVRPTSALFLFILSAPGFRQHIHLYSTVLYLPQQYYIYIILYIYIYFYFYSILTFYSSVLYFILYTIYYILFSYFELFQYFISHYLSSPFTLHYILWAYSRQTQLLAGEHSGAFSSLKANYISQELVDTKNRWKRVNIRLTFTRWPETLQMNHNCWIYK